MIPPILITLDLIKPDGTTTSLKDDFVSAPIFTDLGTGEVNNAIIVISARYGKYITTDPIIDGYDRIAFTLQDEDGNLYEKTFEVVLLVPVETKVSGTKLELHCIGIEHNLQKINYIKPWYGIDALTVAKDIGKYYNENKGSLQPRLIALDAENIELPSWTQNNYDFGLNHETCYNRLIQLIDRLGASVGAGGVLEFYELDIETSGSTITPPTMLLRITPSGETDNGIIIQNTHKLAVGPTEGGFQAQRGFLVAGWGDAGSGSLPVNWSKFYSQEIMFTLHPQWDSTVIYPKDARVQYKGLHYQAISNIPSFGFTPDINPPYWNPITTNSVYGDTGSLKPTTYSPWTKDKKQLWLNSGQNPNNLNSGDVRGIGFYDGNLVVDDTANGYFRTWVNCKASSPSDITTSSLSNYLYGGTDFYRGFRVLVDSTSPSGDWSGFDRNHLTFENAIAEYDGLNLSGPGGGWFVKYRPKNGMIVASLHNGSNYKFNLVDWSTDTSTNANGNDCFHPTYSVSNIPGIFGKFDENGSVVNDTDLTANTNSAIRAEYRWTVPSSGDNTKEWYGIGAWLNFSFPFPENTFGGIGENVGELYGGSIQVSNVPDTNKEPATLDAENMGVLHDGNRGFNKTSSEDYGNLSSVDFIMRMYYQCPRVIPGNFSDVLNIQFANTKMRCLIYDIYDNIVSQDFVLPFVGNWTPIKLPLSAFQIYRARKPVENGFVTIVPPKQLDINNAFQWKDIKRIVIQTQDSYDENGRYLPFNIFTLIGDRWVNPIVVGADSGTIISPIGPTVGYPEDRRILLDIDGFHFTKPLLATTGPVTDRNIEPDFLERDLLTLYDNLSNECFTQLQINKFRHLEYNMETTGKFDVEHGNSIYLYNTRLVPNRLSDGTPVNGSIGSGDLAYPNGDMPLDATNSGNVGFYDNTIKLVAKRLEYSITKPSDASGGFLRKITGIKRFLPA